MRLAGGAAAGVGTSSSRGAGSLNPYDKSCSSALSGRWTRPIVAFPQELAPRLLSCFLLLLGRLIRPDTEICLTEVIRKLGPRAD